MHLKVGCFFLGMVGAAYLGLAGGVLETVRCLKLATYKYKAVASVMAVVFLAAFAPMLHAEAERGGDIFIYVVKDEGAPGDLGLPIYRTLVSEFPFVGVRGNSLPLRYNRSVLYVISPRTNYTAEDNRNILAFVSGLSGATTSPSTAAIKTAPRLDEVGRFLQSVFGPSIRLGLIEQDGAANSLIHPHGSDEISFIRGSFAANQDPYRAVNRLINHDQIDVLLLSDNIRSRKIRKKIFISCLEQGKLAVGTYKRDVSDGALFAMFYDQANQLRTLSEAVRRYRVNKTVSRDFSNESASIVVNTSLSKSKNIPKSAFSWNGIAPNFE